VYIANFYEIFDPVHFEWPQLTCFFTILGDSKCHGSAHSQLTFGLSKVLPIDHSIKKQRFAHH
jgi:hypothetical protein